MRTIIKNVHVFDGENPNLLESRNIVVEDRLVTDIFAGTFSEEGFDRSPCAPGKGAHGRRLAPL